MRSHVFRGGTNFSGAKKGKCFTSAPHIEEKRKRKPKSTRKGGKENSIAVPSDCSGYG